MRKAARSTAARFTWEQILENLIQRLEYQAKIQGLLSLPGKVEKAFPNTVEYLGHLPDQFTLFQPKN